MDLSNTFFIGIAGSGMSALAQYLAMQGHQVSGSDRALQAFLKNPKAAIYQNLGIELFPQDASGLTQNTTCVVRSSAIEDDNIELARARELGIPVVLRSELLTHFVQQKKSIAVAGTSGKSTVTAMIFCILEKAGLSPSLLTGAGLRSLLAAGRPGNSLADKGEWLVFEADESDGSLVNYHPEIGVLLNISQDHKEIDELLPIFKTYAGHIKNTLVYGAEDAGCRSMAGRTSATQGYAFGAGGVQISGQKEIPLENLSLQNWNSTFSLEGVAFEVPVPGLHNVSNALAAISVGLSLEIDLTICAAGLKAFPGIERRFSLVGEAQGITVIDDFAHNPEKIRATLQAVQNWDSYKKGESRILALFQPHGYAPLKLMEKELARMFPATLKDSDRLYLAEVYYAGGTADKTVTSKNVIQQIHQKKDWGNYYPDLDAVLAAVAAEAQPGDIILSMGARDPNLPDFARRILDQFS